MDLGEIKKACDEATPGPWDATFTGIVTGWTRYKWDYTTRSGLRGGRCWHYDVRSRGRSVLYHSVEIEDPPLDAPVPEPPADAVFIANARRWVPALVAEIERLRSELRGA